MDRAEAAESIRKMIEGAYHDRKDYPPLARTSFEDRPRYYRYILKILAEWAES